MDFLALAEACQIKAETASRLIRSILMRQTILLKLCEDSFLPSVLKRQMVELINARAGVLDSTGS